MIKRTLNALFPLLAFASMMLCAADAGAQSSGLIINGQGTAVLSWTAPVMRKDGSPLTDLAGFVVYWDMQSRDGRCTPPQATRPKLDTSCYANVQDLAMPSSVTMELTLSTEREHERLFRGGRL